ncbi:MAG: translation initiation factor IF-2 [Candidatus Aenigmarchaeota archaeon]|nr:translation initiation factor IF-2 [Candidatus Aenigmarchaeota archaeon]
MIRQPIISVLGHVDHGKTTILDSIRKSTVAAGEAGGITQHIGATEVPLNVIKKICGSLIEEEKIKIPGLLFIDTPGHEAFTTLRKRGGSIADLAILVVDINEGFQPQTDESLTFLKEFKTPFVVAANKIDKINGWIRNDTKSFLESFKKQNETVRRDIDTKVYELVGALSERGFNSERFDRIKDFKSTVAIVPVSGLTGEGIGELLMVLIGLSQQFLSDMLEIKEENGYGSVLEVKEVKGLGTTIDVILYDGKIRRGDYLIIGGKNPIVTTVKALLKPRELGDIRVEKRFSTVDEVFAAAGVKIAAPNLEGAISGSPFRTCRNKEDVKRLKEELRREVESVEIERESTGVMVKADTLGSLEGMIKILQDNGIPIKKAEIGIVTRADAMEMSSIKDPLKRVIFAFNVGVLPEAEQISEVKIFQSPVIYKLIEDYQKWKKDKEEEIRMEKLSHVIRPGKIKILPGYIFRASHPAIVGVEVTGGVIKPGYSLVKEGRIVGKVEQIQREGINVSEAKCGDRLAVSISGATVGRQIKEGDELYVAMGKENIRKLEEMRDLLSKTEVDVLEEIKDIIKKKKMMA